MSTTQEVLVKLLRDKSDLGQEASGKALGVLYSLTATGEGEEEEAQDTTTAIERGQEDGQEKEKEKEEKKTTQELIDNLVRLLRGPTATAQPTQLELNVPSGVPLPSASVDIGSNNPFKELCIMATDLGQPQLMYHFLALPTTHAAWAGRRASLYAAPFASTQELQVWNAIYLSMYVCT